MAAEGEVEVFRISPEVGKCYEHAEYTRFTGDYEVAENARYFYKGKPKYVGKFVVTERSGWGDGGNVWSIFNDKGVKNRVDYSYWGKTSFREVECEEPTEENKAKKAAMIRNLNATPPTEIYPGGKNYHRAKANFETLGGKSRKSSRSRRSKRSHKTRKSSRNRKN